MTIGRNIRRIGSAVMVLLFFMMFIPTGKGISWAAEEKNWYDAISTDWGGHVRGQGSAAWPENDSIYELVGVRTYYDGVGNFRLKNRTFFGDTAYVEAHYEAVISGGDTRRKEAELLNRYPFFADDLMFIRRPVDDDRRLMDLTSVIDETDKYIFYHRLDRLLLALQFEKGMVRIGRQAITWGNGLLFNPMDLFNPFAPTDIIRDYKAGDDMITAQYDVSGIGEFQCLVVPRRNPITGDVQWDQTSVAGKFHFARGTTEFDIMGAKHYKDGVVGFGSTGYLLNAAWRADMTYTFLDKGSERDGFLSLIVNMDYSWVWFDKNVYGLIEFYYSGIGEREILQALTNEDIIERIDRGELFTFCEAYLAGEIQVELHPLLKFYLTSISNLNDGSGTVQPRVIWDATSDIQLMVGGNIYYGGTNTEYGGVNIPVIDLAIAPTNNAFMILTYYF